MRRDQDTPSYAEVQRFGAKEPKKSESAEKLLLALGFRLSRHRQTRLPSPAGLRPIAPETREEPRVLTGGTLLQLEAAPLPPRPAKEIVVYACRDHASLKMLEALRKAVENLPKERRPRLKLKLLKLREASQLQIYVEQLDELFGGIYVKDLKKYNIRSLPAIVVDGRKVFEGRHLSESEIGLLLGLSPSSSPQSSPPSYGEVGERIASPQPRHAEPLDQVCEAAEPVFCPGKADLSSHESQSAEQAARIPANELTRPGLAPPLPIESTPARESSLSTQVKHTWFTVSSLPVPWDFRRERLLRIRVKEKDRLEGAELPLQPLAGGKVVRTPSGVLLISEGVARIYAEHEGAWGPLQPLVEYSGTQEFFIREVEGEVYITASIEGKRYVVELPRQLLVDRLAQRIAITAGIPLSERNPQDSGEFQGWRVNLCLPQLAGGWQISAARVVKVDPFRAEPLLLARLVTLAAAPSSITFVGPPGSGKTTALIGVLNTIVSFWPRLRVSIVEEEPELATQVRGPGIVTYFSFSNRSVTDNIRITRRYDRPDILVVGELRGEEVPSWFEAAGSGIPVLTTAHSSGMKDAIKRLDALIQAAGLSASVLDVVRAWVVCGKVISSEGEIQRGVQSVYVVTPEGLQPIFKAGRHLPEKEFLALLPPELQLSLEGSRDASAEVIYERLKLAAGSSPAASFEHLEPLPLSLLKVGEEGWV